MTKRSRLLTLGAVFTLATAYPRAASADEPPRQVSTVRATVAPRGCPATPSFASAAIAFRPGGGDGRIELHRDYLVVVRGRVGDRGGLALVIDTGTLPELETVFACRDGRSAARGATDVIAVGVGTWQRRPVHILSAGVKRQSYDSVLGVRALGISAVQFDLQRMVLSWNE